MTSSLITNFPFIAENSNATPGLFNRAYQVIQDNFVTLQSTVTGLSSQISAGGTVAVPGEGRTTPTATSYLSTNAAYNVIDYGALTTGASGITTAQSVASAAGRGIVIPFQPSKISTSITITTPLRIEPGAPLTTASGATVTITGPLDAGPYPIFQNAAVDFTGNTVIPVFLPQWWGILGKGEDDTASLASMIAVLPKGAVVQFSGGMNVKFSAWTIGPGKEGIRFLGATDARQNGGEQPYTALTYTGAAGGVMITIDSSTFIELSNFRFASGPAAVVVDLDGHNGHIGSNCLIARNVFSNASNRTDWVGVRISRTVNQNHEYHTIRENLFTGVNRILTSIVNVNASSGSNVFTIVGQNQTSNFSVGARVWVPGAGAAGATYQSTVSAAALVGSDTRVQCATDVSTSTTATTMSVSDAVGIAIQQSPGDGITPPSQNVHHTRIELNDISHMRYGVEAVQGNFHAWRNQLFSNEANYHLGGNSMVCTTSRDNTETSFRHFLLDESMGPSGGPYPVICEYARLDVSNAIEGGGYIERPFNGFPVVLQGCTIENATSLTTASPFLKGMDQNIAIRDCKPSATISHGLLGGQPEAVEIAGDLNLITNALGTSVGARKAGVVFGDQNNHVGGIRGLGFFTGGGNRGNYMTGVWGEGNIRAAGKTDPDVNPAPFWSGHSQEGVGWTFGLTGTFAANIANDGFNNNMGAIHARLAPLLASNARVAKGVGLYVSAASTSSIALGYSASLTGVLIEGMAGTNITNPIAIDQQGPSDLNKFAGVINAASGFSVGVGGTVIPAISSLSSKIGAFVVQPSASSFTVVTWAAVKAGDVIQVTPFNPGAVSSLSSGIVAHSHCTQNGQIELRLSNVSTLAQNQSSMTWYFVRTSPF